MRPFFLSLATTSILLLAAPAFAAFGITASSSAITVDTGAALVYKVHPTNGNIISLVFNGVELQDQSKFTHIASGFGSSTVTSKIVSSTYAVVTIVSTQIGGTITHYYVAKSGTPTIFIATHVTAEPTIGELRFIARLKKSALPGGNVNSEIAGCDTVVEGSDVFKCSNGNVRSKFYSSVQHINDQVHGVTGTNLGVWMVIPGTGYEKSSGGPFFRDINNQGGSQQELYYYMNSGHQQTEAYRTGLNGPYAMVFNTGKVPSADLDTSFFASLGIKDFVTPSGRGTVSGTATGISSAFLSKIVVGWASASAQYWTKATSAGVFTSPLMIPGTYTQTLYKSELEVGTKTNVVVAAGKAVTGSNIASDESLPKIIWHLGDRDGTPSGFLNANKIETMHPSDARMSAWGPVIFTVGTDAISKFPMAQFKSVNSPTTIKFTLTADQVASARTFEIGVTSSFAGARPQITVNGSFKGPAPSAPTKIDSRGVTRGTWRGFNTVYPVTIPVGKLIAGVNTVTVDAISGSDGTTFLSPNFVYDFVRLY